MRDRRSKRYTFVPSSYPDASDPSRFGICDPWPETGSVKRKDINGSKSYHGEKD